MTNEIISYLEMCQREGVSLQRGMNFHLSTGYSVVLMSQRPNAPYADRIEDEGTTLIYEGHDAPKGPGILDPKAHDQPEVTASGRLTENGKFHFAAQRAKQGLAVPEHVRVYEKLRQGIWSYNGLFRLVDSWTENNGIRNVFKFRLELVEYPGGIDFANSEPSPVRLIPSDVKLTVWKRDNGRCVICGATDNLHFDHVIPFSRGGTSNKAENIQLLCARHNLAKRDKIE